MTKRVQSLHEKRGVSFAELGAVYAVQAMLKANVLVYESLEIEHDPGKHVINMGTACDRAEDCGSIACIGGTMGLVMGLDQPASKTYVAGADVCEDERRVYTNDLQYGKTIRSPALANLFYPPDKYDFTTITKRQMLLAIQNWLDTGRAGWSKILTRDQLA